MIEVIEHGEVRELKLARPPANALSPELLNELQSQIASAPGDGARALGWSADSNSSSARWGPWRPQKFRWLRPSQGTARQAVPSSPSSAIGG